MGRLKDATLESVKGAAAGAAATWAMGRVTSFMWQHETPASRRKYDEVTGGEYVPDRAAKKTEAWLGLEPNERRERALAEWLHWGVGLGAGIGYALLRRAVPEAARGQGLLFGLVFWVLFDELATVASGLARPPRAYPWQAHARGLAGHLAFGLAADTTLDLLERLPVLRRQAA